MCHCGALFKGSDHCPFCFCEYLESYCERKVDDNLDENAKLYNVYVQTDNYQDREFTILDTEYNVRHAVEDLLQWDHVKDVSFGLEYADMGAEDLKEEVGAWISGEY